MENLAARCLKCSGKLLVLLQECFLNVVNNTFLTLDGFARKQAESLNLTTHAQRTTRWLVCQIPHSQLWKFTFSSWRGFKSHKYSIPHLPHPGWKQVRHMSIQISVTFHCKKINARNLIACLSLAYLFAVHVWLKIEVSLKELHRIRDWTLGDLCVYSANFWARKPPREAPKRWT